MQNAAIYFYVLLLARGSGVVGWGGGEVDTWDRYKVPKLYPYYKNSSVLIPSYTRKISFVTHYVCILPLNSQTILGFGS